MPKISEQEYLNIKAIIVRKLYAKRAFSKGHILLERLQHGIPPHYRGFVKEIIGVLIKEKIIVYYGRTKYGDAYQLNIEKLKDIKEILN